MHPYIHEPHAHRSSTASSSYISSIERSWTARSSVTNCIFHLYLIHGTIFMNRTLIGRQLHLPYISHPSSRSLFYNNKKLKDLQWTNIQMMKLIWSYFVSSESQMSNWTVESQNRTCSEILSTSSVIYPSITLSPIYIYIYILDPIQQQNKTRPKTIAASVYLYYSVVIKGFRELIMGTTVCGHSEWGERGVPLLS